MEFWNCNHTMKPGIIFIFSIIWENIILPILPRKRHKRQTNLMNETLIWLQNSLHLLRREAVFFRFSVLGLRNQIEKNNNSITTTHVFLTQIDSCYTACHPSMWPYLCRIAAPWDRFNLYYWDKCTFQAVAQKCSSKGSQEQ